MIIVQLSGLGRYSDTLGFSIHPRPRLEPLQFRDLLGIEGVKHFVCQGHYISVRLPRALMDELGTKCLVAGSCIAVIAAAMKISIADINLEIDVDFEEISELKNFTHSGIVSTTALFAGKIEPVDSDQVAMRGTAPAYYLR